MTLVQTKKYQSFNDTLHKFTRFLEKNRSKGKFVLPSERELCKELYCSRTTLRRLLEHQEANGIIIKEGCVRSISVEPANVSSSIGCFAFISIGQGMISNPAWNKLWMALTEKAEAEHISAKLILLSSSDSLEEIESKLANLPDIIVLTTLEPTPSTEIIRNLSKKILITTEENYRGELRNIVAMDNYEAGYLAAKKLAENGYRKPCCINHRIMTRNGKFYVPHEKRVRGFLEGCRKFRLEVNEKTELHLFGKHYKLVEQLVKAARKVARDDFDSVFLSTDPKLDFFYEALAEKIAIPEEIGLVTVNSFNFAVNHNPPVSSVSHGTKSVAEALIKQIEHILKTGNSDIGEIMIKPTFHKGATLK